MIFSQKVPITKLEKMFDILNPRFQIDCMELIARKVINLFLLTPKGPLAIDSNNKQFHRDLPTL